MKEESVMFNYMQLLLFFLFNYTEYFLSSEPTSGILEPVVGNGTGNFPHTAATSVQSRQRLAGQNCF